MLVVLTVAPLAAVYRTGRRRAFWVGFSVCGLAYVTLSSGPGFSVEIGPRLVTTEFLRWAYPRVIPEARRATNPLAPESFSISGGNAKDRVKGLDRATLDHGFVDVLVEGQGDEPTPLVGNVKILHSSFGGGAFRA